MLILLLQIIDLYLKINNTNNITAERKSNNKRAKINKTQLIDDEWKAYFQLCRENSQFTDVSEEINE